MLYNMSYIVRPEAAAGRAAVGRGAAPDQGGLITYIKYVTYICIYIYIYVCMYVGCIYIYIYIYICIHTQGGLARAPGRGLPRQEAVPDVLVALVLQH